MTSHRRRCDVILTSCVHWEGCRPYHGLLKIRFKLGKARKTLEFYKIFGMHFFLLSLEAFMSLFRCLGGLNWKIRYPCLYPLSPVRVSSQENMSVKYVPPQTPLLWQNWGTQGYTYFSYFCSKHRLWVGLLVRTASVMLCFEQK